MHGIAQEHRGGAYCRRERLAIRAGGESVREGRDILRAAPDMADSPPTPPNPPACRKCAFVFEAGAVFERCPNCGTPTQAPPEEAGRVILPRLTALPLPGTPIGSIRKTPANASLEGFFVPPTLVGDRPPGEQANVPSAPTSRPPSQPSPEASNGDVDLPAPVSTTRPFTLPRIEVPRMAVSSPLDSRDLENSAELDLPHLSEMSTVTARTVSRSDDVEVDLADIKAETRELPTQPDAPLPPPRPQLQSRRPTVIVTPTTPEPGALAYVGLVGLFAALAACWWFYYSRAQEVSLVAGAYASQVLSDAAAIRERDERLAALFDDDTIDGYLAAMTVAEQTDDPLGRAEAALRIHLRYGPDPVRASQAEVWLAATAGRESDRAERIRALAALAEGDHRKAQNLLAAAAEPGVALYRGLLALAVGDHKVASEHASEAMSLRTGDQTARWLNFATELAKDRRASLDGLRDVADRQPQRPALQLLLVDALIARGRLAEARKRLEALVREPGVSDVHQARVLVRHARVAASSVEVSRSVYWADEAIKLAPRDPEVVHASLRVLIEADELARAQQGLTARLRDAPDDLEAQILQADLALRASNESAAAKAIEKLAAEPPTLLESTFLRGRLALLAGNTEDAARQFHTAASAQPAHVRAAVEYARLRPREDTLKLLEKLLERRSRDPTESARADLRALALAAANVQAELGRRDEAINALDRALAMDCDDNAAQLRRGVLTLETARADAGRVDLLAVNERTGGFAGLLGPLSRLYIQSGELRQLEAMVQPHLSDVRAPDETVLAIARLRLAQGAVEAAESLTDQILLRSPGSWEGHLLKAKVLLARGEPVLAQQELRLSRPVHANADVELVAGKIAERGGRLQEALAAYRRAHQLAPTLHEAGFLYGRALLQLGRAQEAVTELSAVTKATEAFPGAFVALGQALHERANFEEGRRQLQRAVALEPGLAEAHYWLGRCEYELQLHAEAAVSLGRAVRGAAPETLWLPDAHLWLARASEAHGDVAASRTAYEEFLRLAAATAPGRREAERALARLARAP
ncbi:tetratricopeptide repeat protein [Nannocystis radixulma]|uniref:Tetratricopeptide repeat protein n=1 Tax=Nannocystis radixulma TaxID=2995305 RepID=A0ABT5BB37_9BACT|nr:tetratricopeptide repeat protein [Nannocystis radixulma]MDC0671345.1 tetratricopeptide repeat protein [Nannocystis radixulma]